MTKRQRYTTTEKIAEYLNELENIQAENIEVGVVGQNLFVSLKNFNKETQDKKHKVLIKEFTKLGLGYKTVPGMIGEEEVIRQYNLKFKDGESFLLTNIEYLQSRNKRRLGKPERFTFKNKKN